MEIQQEPRSRDINVSKIFISNHPSHAHGENGKLLISNISIYTRQVDYIKAVIPSIDASLF